MVAHPTYTNVELKATIAVFDYDQTYDRWEFYKLPFGLNGLLSSYHIPVDNSIFLQRFCPVNIPWCEDYSGNLYRFLKNYNFAPFSSVTARTAAGIGGLGVRDSQGNFVVMPSFNFSNILDLNQAHLITLPAGVSYLTFLWLYTQSEGFVVKSCDRVTRKFVLDAPTQIDLSNLFNNYKDTSQGNDNGFVCANSLVFSQEVEGSLQEYTPQGLMGNYWLYSDQIEYLDELKLALDQFFTDRQNIYGTITSQDGKSYHIQNSIKPGQYLKKATMNVLATGNVILPDDPIFEVEELPDYIKNHCYLHRANNNYWANSGTIYPDLGINPALDTKQFFLESFGHEQYAANNNISFTSRIRAFNFNDPTDSILSGIPITDFQGYVLGEYLLDLPLFEPYQDEIFDRFLEVGMRMNEIQIYFEDTSNPVREFNGTLADKLRQVYDYPFSGQDGLYPNTVPFRERGFLLNDQFLQTSVGFHYDDDFYKLYHNTFNQTSLVWFDMDIQPYIRNYNYRYLQSLQLFVEMPYWFDANRSGFAIQQSDTFISVVVDSQYTFYDEASQTIVEKYTHKRESGVMLEQFPQITREVFTESIIWSQIEWDSFLVDRVSENDFLSYLINLVEDTQNTMVDSIRVQEIHSVLGTLDYVYQDELNTPSYMNLGRRIEFLSQEAGLHFNNDGSVYSVRQRRNIAYENNTVTIPAGWLRGQYAINIAGDNPDGQLGGEAGQALLGIAYQQRSNVLIDYELLPSGEVLISDPSNAITVGNIVLCQNKYQYLESYYDDLASALDWGDAAVMPVPNSDNTGEYCLNTGLATAVAENQYMISAISSNITRIEIMALKIEAMMLELIKHTGAAIVPSNIPVSLNSGNTPDEREFSIQYPSISPDTPSQLTQHFNTLSNIAPILARCTDILQDNGET